MKVKTKSTAIDRNLLVASGIHRARTARARSEPESVEQLIQPASASGLGSCCYAVFAIHHNLIVNSPKFFASKSHNANIPR